MSFEEEFDRIIRQKTDQADFPFDEKNWEKARHLLDLQRKVPAARNKGKFYALALLLLSLGIAGWMIFGSTKNAPLNVQTALTAKEDVTLANVANSLHESISERVAPSVKQIGQESKDVSRSPITKAKRPLLQHDFSSTVSETPQRVESRLPENQSHPSEQKASAPVDNKHDGYKENEATHEVKKETPLPVNTEMPSANAKNVVQSDENTTLTQDNIFPETNEMPYLPLSYNTFPMATADEAQLLPVTFNHLPNYDEDYYKPKHHKQFLNAEVGASYLAGWDTKTGKDGKGFNWFGGINYGVYISKKIGVGLGIQLYNVNHIAQPFYNNSKTVYGFGSTSSQTVITSNSLYYGAIPVKLYYTINPQNQVGLGANIGVVMSSRNTVENYTLSDNVRVSASKSTNMGVYQGINTTNLMLSAFYKTQLAKRFYANGEVIYGLSDIFKNLNTVNTERVIGIRLSLQYTLFDK